MKSIFGNNLIVSLFGESHGDFIGVTLNGLPSGKRIDYDFLEQELLRRRPKGEENTKRVENDDYEIISGVFNGFTTGAPLTILIKNKDVKSGDYLEGVIRPGSSDYPSYVRSSGYNDYRGSGHFSGRLTAGLVAGGAIIKKILEDKGIHISSNVADYALDTNDTYGFITKVVVKGLPIGVGEPFFDNMESVLAHLLFAIPSVKGVSFGDDDIYLHKGSEVVDELKVEDGNVVIKNNHNGGINGGLSNGNDVIINVKFKPISSLRNDINTINIKTMENITIIGNDRNDKSIANRAPVIVESMVGFGLMDLLISFYGSNELKWWKDV